MKHQYIRSPIPEKIFFDCNIFQHSHQNKTSFIFYKKNYACLSAKFFFMNVCAFIFLHDAFQMQASVSTHIFFSGNPS